MIILLAPDSFKGSISSAGVIEVWAKALNEHTIPVKVISQPLSDGGEGFVEACCQSDCRQISIDVLGPLNKPVKARYGLTDGMAFIEMAASSGIELLDPTELNPMVATTYGLGQMIHDAIEQGARKLYIGLGGSATHDAGMGMLRALGARFTNNNLEITSFQDVEYISSINLDSVIQLLSNVEVICAADVNNSLCGSNGAAHVYAKQKGATPAMIEQLDMLSYSFAEKLESHLQESFRDIPGTGAAGGTGFALIACLGAEMIPGFEVVAGVTQLEESVRKADLVITGEGYLDQQSSFGKAPVQILHMANRHNVPVAGVFGGIGQTNESFSLKYSLSELAGSKEEAMNNPRKYLIEAVKIIIQDFTA